MKFLASLVLVVMAGSAAASPVHVALKATADVSPNADGFFTLGSVAAVTGGDTPLRTRLAGIPVGRAPLSGETRRLTRGDLALKLRQAGCDPDKVAVLEGAEIAEVTTESPRPAAPIPSPSLVSGEGIRKENSPSPLPPAGEGTGASSPIIHRGDAVTIVIQTGPLTINAPGIARENGREGQAIRVHREGVMTDLVVHVVDAQTVQLEI